MNPAPNHDAVSGGSVVGHVQRMFGHVRLGNLVAGLSGGVASTLVLHPLDLVKIRFAGTERTTWPSWLVRSAWIIGI